ncbi:hypothetical protein ABTY59_31810 [Streptomyces sp. NPDC096079]|uniref:hypothetical protein n=1 Tax=Streptomyces sp. NPDC096079 TaxID=3155820 RepID=UPI00332D2562
MPGTIAPQRARNFRTPSGLPNPPIILFAGPEFTGKSWEAAAGTGSDLIATSYWIQVGGVSGTADQYGRLAGARYEIVPHDGSFDDILDALRAAIAQPSDADGKRNMLVIDDISSVWDLLSDEVSFVSRRRAERRGLRLDDEPVDDERDLWIQAKDRWGEMLWLLRQHNGPTLLIARQETVTAFENDKPTAHTSRRIKAEKNIRSAVDAIVEFKTLGEAYITGAHSAPQHWEIKPGWIYRYDGLDDLLRRLGYQDAVSTRAVTELRPEAVMQARHQQAGQPPSSQPAAPPAVLSSKQIMGLVHKALQDETDPKQRLIELREEWGKRILRTVPTKTKLFGELNADDLITRAIVHHDAQAEKRAESGPSSGRTKSTGSEHNRPPRGEPTGQDNPAGNAAAAEAAAGPSGPEPKPAQERAVEEPLAEGSAPPPPDPEAEEPPPTDEVPEETSQAEEPQDRPTPPARTRVTRGAAVALKALRDEVKVQARLQFLTEGDYLRPISGSGEPSMMELKQYVEENRPRLIAQLESDGEQELADVYRNAPLPDPQIARKFAAHFDPAVTK